MSRRWCVFTDEDGLARVESNRSNALEWLDGMEPKEPPLEITKVESGHYIAFVGDDDGLPLILVAHVVRWDVAPKTKWNRNEPEAYGSRIHPYKKMRLQLFNLNFGD